MVDPPHGGFDGGCVAADGTNEKDINLAVSLELDGMLRLLGFDTMLVRATDRSVETEGTTIREKKRSDITYRHALMKKHPDCIYLCIHQNQYQSPSSHGAQIFYTPSNDGAKTLAESIQTNIISLVQPDNKRKIKPCTDDVYIIHKAPDTATAVLIECGFLSNPNDLADLKDSQYRAKLCLAVIGGLTEWMTLQKDS